MLSVLHSHSACPSAWSRERYSVKDAKRWFANDWNQAVGDPFEKSVTPMCVEVGNTSDNSRSLTALEQQLDSDIFLGASWKL